MDCMDIKAILSGLADDEIDRETRHEAERHLAGCKPCRGLINEAEGLNSMIRLEGQSLIARELPEGFEAAVLARTVYPQTYKFREHRRMWTTYVGWMAAAACVALASLIWIERLGRNNTNIADNGDGQGGSQREAVKWNYPTEATLQNGIYVGDHRLVAN